MTYQAPAVIDSFSGQWRFLSNFWPAPVTLDGLEFATTEAAYQASKAEPGDPVRATLALPEMRPGKAKRLGRAIILRPDWSDELARATMLDLTRQKFARPANGWADTPLGALRLDKALLTATGDAELIEGNTWHDNRWGVCRCGGFKECDGSGLNWLGQTIMAVRTELRG